MRMILAALCLLPSLVFAQAGSITVSLSKAEVCAPSFCAPVLIGKALKEGRFPILHARVLNPAYGGDVLAFDTRSDGVPLAIHRVWLGKPSQRRIERLQGPVEQRLGITGGCINVMPDVFQQLVDCCSKGTVTVTP